LLVGGSRTWVSLSAREARKLAEFIRWQCCPSPWRTTTPARARMTRWTRSDNVVESVSVGD
jgi:hypothetical protein